ncbi:MAG: YesL family protein [Christensenellaceae bacterium]|nr:YesL family protein [Christensenellaceae bacterium]
MFGKLMNSYYYGKSGKGDYRKEDLPRTRWQLFWEMLRIRFSGLIRMNLTYMLVWLPAMVVLLMGVMSVLYGVAPSGEQLAADPAAIVEEGELPSVEEAETAAVVELSPAEFLSMMQSVLWFTLLLLIPCITITGPFTAGLCYVTRNWARDEHAFAWSDFIDAVKANWKPSIIVSFITALMPVTMYLCWTYYGEMANTNAVMVIPQTITVMLGLLWSLAVTYTYPMIVSYKMRLRDVLRNSFLLAIGRLPMSVGVRLLHCVPIAVAILVSLFSTPVAVFGLLAYYILMGFGLSRFVTASYTNAVFDRYINSRIEGATVNRGLNTEPDDDDEDDEEEEAGEE